MDGRRWIVFLLLATSLVSFFFPLISVQIPLLGNQSWSGYDAMSRIPSLQRQFAPEGRSTRKANAEQTEPANPQMPEMPFSVQYLGLVPVEIGTAFACAVLALLLLLGNSRNVMAFTTFGAIAAVGGIIHVAVANSDLHSWFQATISANTIGQTDDLSAGLEKLGGLIANSVQLNPGWGMFLLAGSLAISVAVTASQPNTESEETPTRGGGFITAGE